MDKETLSNYGWIVICVLVLAVMIALAGPFGNFVADAVKSTTQGLFDVNQNALDAADVPGLTVQDQEFDVPGSDETVSVYYGDIDMDGDIDNDDLTMLQLHVAGTSVLTDSEQLARADVNGDGTITVSDRLTLAQYVNGMIDSFPVES